MTVDQEAMLILIDHSRTEISGCHCGWGVATGHLGRSHAEHVVAKLREAGLLRSDRPE